ncbi:MAG: hypothetical protein U1D25_08645 [Hydrogenophaga sp.]|uniref:hypothetical protein n=1 Tax=Hydrogenophaga sp. TaxID=1904254 RepID=UPI002ABB81FA|nr:hypothetical protein [Hydrogenophaga sp.]MDZ4188158.1 hypothetical protein [Hydrogenophaga sp.]
METSTIARLTEVYRRYGFYLAKNKSKDGILVFTLKTGYFDNAEILRLSANIDTDSIFQEFTSAGYACTVRLATSPEKAEEELFQGFFSVEATRLRLFDDYKRFSSSLVAPYGPNARYEYIEAPYQINGKTGESNPPAEVLRRLNESGPILFLIEAAAGFGKTCTALEIVKLLSEDKSHLPLYAELSRNRQARIFRYILLDEIDRTFPLLNSSLVQTEIKNGRIATILDGFDELLRKNQETGEFENQEPMLETVSELLTGRAKVIITTRRTVLFDGDDFHNWLERHADSFEVVRIRIQEPKIGDWLTPERLEILKNSGLNMEAMANPVLLSYLRCIELSELIELAKHPEDIVDSYFEYMIERERQRQDLMMTIQAQGKILRAIAKDMMDRGYTAEHRDYIINFILSTQSKIVDDARMQYSTSERPTREEVANKLASHALLDRSSNEPSKIGFINEFALGNYVAENIVNEIDWLSDDLRFIEPAVRSYIPRTESSRSRLYDSLSESLPYLDTTAQIEISIELLRRLPENLMLGGADLITFEQIDIGSLGISNFQFNECIFKNCTLFGNGLSNVTFLNCKLYDCSVSGDLEVGSVYMLGGLSNPDLSAYFTNPTVDTSTSANPNAEVDAVMLQKFWPVGESYKFKPTRPIYKPIRAICHPSEKFTFAQLYSSFDRLKKRGILNEMTKSNLVTLNFELLTLAQDILSEIEK